MCTLKNIATFSTPLIINSFTGILYGVLFIFLISKESEPSRVMRKFTAKDITKINWEKLNDSNLVTSEMIKSNVPQNLSRLIPQFTDMTKKSELIKYINLFRSFDDSRFYSNKVRPQRIFILATDDEAPNHERLDYISKNIIRAHFPENHVGLITNRTK